MRSGRLHDVVVDTTMAVIAVAVGLTSAQNVVFGPGDRPVGLALADVILGVGCLAGIWLWRRRFPVAFALAAIAVGVVSTLAGGVALICVFTVAELKPWRTAVAVSALAAVSILPTMALYPVDHETRAITVGALATFAATGWGMYVGARRQLLASLRRQLEGAEQAATARAAEARRGERERIAREMHDVLAHRLSLLAVHAGALEYNQAASPEEVTKVVGIIRSNTHEALDELRQVISLLRDRQPDEVRPNRPWPTCRLWSRSPGWPASWCRTLPRRAHPTRHPMAVRRTASFKRHSRMFASTRRRHASRSSCGRATRAWTSSSATTSRSRRGGATRPRGRGPV